jgi:hypothetical protein
MTTTTKTFASRLADRFLSSIANLPAYQVRSEILSAIDSSDEAAADRRAEGNIPAADLQTAYSAVLWDALTGFNLQTPVGARRIPLDPASRRGMIPPVIEFNPTTEATAMTTNLYLSDNQTDTLRKIQKGGADLSRKAKTVESLVALLLVERTGSGEPMLTALGEAALRERLDARNARARAEAARARAESARREAEAAAAAKRTPEETARLIDAYVAERKARGDDRIGLLNVAADGTVYEWCSWERMMSE